MQSVSDSERIINMGIWDMEEVIMSWKPEGGGVSDHECISVFKSMMAWSTGVQLSAYVAHGF